MAKQASTKKGTFSKATAARQRSRSEDHNSVTKILERLDKEPGRKHRFLLVDNEESVIQDWKSTLFANPKLGTHAEFHLFLFLEPNQKYSKSGVTAGTLDDLLQLIRRRILHDNAFDGFFIDGNLGAGAKGLDGLGLIRHLRDTIEEIRYCPFALVTVSLENTEFRQQAADSDIIRYMPKFDSNDASLLPRMILEFSEMHAQSRQAAWGNLNQTIALLIETGGGAAAVGQAAAEFLIKHMGVKALYFRDGAHGVLSAFTMVDHFDAGKELKLVDAPHFFRNFVSPGSINNTDPWLCLEHISKSGSESPRIIGMQRWRALLARVGDPVDREGGVYAIYSPPEHARFRSNEGPSLHHLAVQLSNARASEREGDKLRARQRRITELLNVFTHPNSSEEVGHPLASFLHAEFGKAFGARAKATVRLFERGSGNLVRVGGPVGDLRPTKPLDKININDTKSTYARVVRTMQPVLYSDVGEHTHEFVFTNTDVRSSLTLPLSFQEACYGAANLESDQINAFSPDDQQLAGKIVETAAAAIARQRSLWFLGEAAELLETIAESPTGADATTLLSSAAGSLYRLCGFSDLIIAMPPVQDGQPWRVAEVFRAIPGEEDVSRADDQLLHDWREWVRARWPRSHLCRVLQGPDEFVFTNVLDEFDDDRSLRPDRPTLSQATLKVSTPGALQPEAMLALLFEHHHPFSSRQKQRLKAFGQFMGRLFLAQGRARSLKSQVSIQSQEAWLGRISSTYQHNFKLGLWSMSGWIESASKGSVSPADAIKKISEMILQLAPLVERMSNLVKPVEVGDLDTGAMWEELRQQYNESASLNEVVLQPAPADLPNLRADPIFLRSIIFTLLENAIRYAGPNTVVSVARSDNGLVVADNGRGLRAEIKAKLFEPGNTTGSISTGQGLYVARLMAREMDGDLVHLASETGTAFEICLVRCW
ncbi:GAF domain-containing sensor histidine kinase [Rhodopseudomonas palustris]